MSWARLTSELHARPEPPHPLDISLETGVSDDFLNILCKDKLPDRIPG